MIKVTKNDIVMEFDSVEELKEYEKISSEKRKYKKHRKSRVLTPSVVGEERSKEAVLDEKLRDIAQYCVDHKKPLSRGGKKFLNRTPYSREYKIIHQYMNMIKPTEHKKDERRVKSMKFIAKSSSALMKKYGWDRATATKKAWIQYKLSGRK